MDFFHNCKASFPVRQPAQLMATYSFLQTACTSAVCLHYKMENVDWALVMKACTREPPRSAANTSVFI